MKTLLRISRPRFWIYLLGPALIGVVAGVSSLEQFVQPFTLLVLLFFTFPANLLIYGVNDWSDRDTDRFNAKKTSYEHLLEQQERSLLLVALLLVMALTVLLWLVLPLLSKVWFLLWLFLSIGYSVSPLRFKARPLIDAYSNLLYALPGLVLYSLFVVQLPPWWLVVALLCWNAAMHTLSALPDIAADSKAGLRTTAVVLGRKKASRFVLINWVVAVSLPVLLMTSVPWWTLAPLLVYPFVGYCALKSDNKALFALYQKMPLLNGLIGMYLFWLVLLSRFGLDALWHILQ